MVSSTCSEAFKKSPISKEPEHEGSDRFIGEDRFVAPLLSMLVAPKHDNETDLSVG